MKVVRVGKDNKYYCIDAKILVSLTGKGKVHRGVCV